LVKFETGPQHPPDHARDAALELDEALRIKQANPNLIVNVGTDENAPIRPNSVSPKFPNGERMASFDIEVTDPATGEVRHVEVTRANPNRRGTTGITRPDELTSAVRHATDKLRSREQDGSPIQGTKEVSIEVNFQSGELPGKKGSREVHDGQGGYTVYPSPHVDKEIKKNILDDFQRDLPKIGGTDKLDVVRLTDPNGNVVAEFKRDPNTNTWTRVTP
jgi:hypothetical protein